MQHVASRPVAAICILVTGYVLALIYAMWVIAYAAWCQGRQHIAQHSVTVEVD